MFLKIYFTKISMKYYQKISKMLNFLKIFSKIYLSFLILFIDTNTCLAENIIITISSFLLIFLSKKKNTLFLYIVSIFGAKCIGRRRFYQKMTCQGGVGLRAELEFGLGVQIINSERLELIRTPRTSAVSGKCLNDINPLGPSRTSPCPTLTGISDCSFISVDRLRLLSKFITEYTPVPHFHPLFVLMYWGWNLIRILN